MSDSNKKFVVKAAECHLGATFADEDSSLLDEFLNTDNVLTLCAIVDEQGMGKFLREIDQDHEKLVIFWKNRPAVLDDQNLASTLQITSVSGPPSLALYNSLGNVFSPLLKVKNNSSIQRHIANLQADLRSTILEGVSISDYLIIVESLEHEVEYWDSVAHSGKNRLARTSAASFRDILKTISKELGVVDALPLNEVEDVLENAHNVLDDLWRHEPPYPKDRMIHLMDLIANDVGGVISSQLRSKNIWTDNYIVVFETLTQCISVGERWLATCQQLTEIFWPNYSSNMWKDEPYRPEELVRLVERLQEILSVQTLHRQLTRLLTTQEQDDLQTDAIFRPFTDVDILEFGQCSTNLWLKAGKQFEHLLQPAEERVAAKLKKQLSSVNANARQLLHEFSRYSELISRPILKQTLLTERQQLLTSLYDYVKQLQQSQNAEHPEEYDGTPRVVSEIIATRQLEARAGEVQRTAQKLLSDLQGYENLNQIVTELLKDLKQQHNELFESWTGEVSALIKDETLSLKEIDSVVQFSSSTKLMKVNYSPRLVALISEVRQFKAFGYHVPSHIEQTSEHAKKFMKLARVLEQIANFHNTIGDRMITCQRPMMLNSALELSRLVQEEKVVSWGDTKSVEKYVDTLKKAVEKLARENNSLASYYYQIMEKIKSLEDVDLIKDYSKWKDTSRQIRTIMEQVEEKGFRNMQAWKSDVDANLRRVLEKQYIKSLDTLHLYLPEIYADIIYRNAQLQFSPEEQILKEKYQQQLSKFLDIPRSFRGVAVGNFAEIIEASRDNLEKVDRHTEDLFEQLRGVLKHWQSWLQLDPLDVGKLQTWQHWDLHFRASKTFGQEIAKLPSSEDRVGCFSIGLARLRSDLESHNRSYWDQLMISLKDAIAQDVVQLQNYVDPSTAVLTRQPVTLEEVGESGASHANILKQAPEMEECYNQMIQKSQILSSWTREQVDSVNRLKGAWERLQSLLENHQHIIAKQMETIKTTLNIESENMEKELERFAAKLDQVKSKPNTFDQSLEELNNQLKSIKEKKVQWQDLVAKKAKLMSDYTRFNIEKPEFAMMEEIENDLNREENSWAMFEQFYTELEALSQEEWIVFRKKIYKFQDFLLAWQSKLKDYSQSEDLVKTRILQEIQKYEGVVPSLKYVRGEDFTDKHWMDVFGLLAMPPKPLDILIVQDFLLVSDKISENSKELQVICKKAASEIIVRQALSELDQWDVQAKFTLTPHEDSRKTKIMLVKDFKEILSKIGDNQSLLQSVKNSADYESFSERASLWENKLAMLEQNLGLLAQIQRKWVYLEPIFGTGTLIKSRFDKIDKDFHHVSMYIEKDPRVSSLSRYPNLTAVLKNLQDQLGRCQKSLDNFLMEKRDKFPRFLFLNDDDLLEVVGQSSKEQVIQTHLKKLFAGIDSIKLDESEANIAAMCSLQGETVQLTNAVNVNKPVEDWLNSLVKSMQATLKELLVQCLGEGQSPDPLKYPSQVLCLADGINFTLKTEQAIGNMTLPPLLGYYKAQLSHYSSLELNAGDESSLSVVDEDDADVLELKLKALLLDTIHHIGVLECLLDENVTKITDWVWQKQLRFYSNSMGEITVKMANARMDYAYEYLGNAPKLVRTPLTDRCFLTLTQGMHLGMGGNPYGPAGTGKTESVKALGHLLGRQVLVFNCDEGIDAASMGRILSGLVRSGAWGCFDEFNRLDEATLSAVSMQIHPIQVALRTHQAKLTLLEQEVSVNKHCGIFVTLNPAGGSYGGRNKLPDNLKQLFRPVVMTHPDHEQIAKTLLLCDGYQNADLIGKKIIEVFDAAAKLLSKRQHYDWGLRAIRTVLTGCRRTLKQHRKRVEGAENSLMTELGLAVKVLRMDTLSKLTFDDGQKFDGVLRDVFKDVSLENTGDDALMVKALEECYQNMGLVVNERQIGKCLELYEQLKQRMGVAVVGPPSSGKSTVRNLLFHALTKTKKVLKQHVFNPKSMQKTELLGQIDLDTRQWSDGVLTLYSLQVTSEPSDVWSWIVCDGNIDPDWVESLNSVLDDNRLLTLPSGWRVQFGSNVNFIFETHDLSHASPATISRMGIVLLSEEDVNLNDYVQSSIQGDTLLASYVSDYFLRAVNWVVDEGEVAIPISKLSIAQTGLSQVMHARTKAQFTVGLLNGLGQQLQVDFRELFAQQLYEWLSEIPPPVILKSKYNEDRDMIDVYYTNPNLTIAAVDQSNNGRIPLVLTGDVLQTLDGLRTWLLVPGQEQHFLLIGPHGSGKTLILQHLVQERSDVEMCTIHCSANLTPSYVITKISQLCMAINTNKGKVYKPKKGHLVLCFKNLHLLKPDKWGTNLLVEFLHQLITYKAFFDASLELVGVENLTIVGTLCVSNVLSTRFTSILHTYNVNLPEQEDLSVIVVAYLSALVKECSKNVWPKAKIVKLAATIISIYDKVRSAFSSTQYKHYEFSPHDITNWCSSILRYKNSLSNEMDNYITEVVCHEALKLFGDKLVSDEDKAKLDAILNETFKAQWDLSNFTKIVQMGFYAPLDHSSELTKMNTEQWESCVAKGISQYEREGQNLDVMINDELLQLTSSVAKTLSMPEGNLVLVGRSGIGRKSSIKIVSALQNAKLIVASDHFNNDLKLALQMAGLEGEQVYLLLEDQILDRKNVLNTINILVSAGEVPGLYNAVELESMIAGLKEEAGRDNFEGNLMEYLNERIKRNLHAVVCIDVDNENLRGIFENCPAFLHKSSTIWRTEWNGEAIKMLPAMLIDKYNRENRNQVEQCKNFPKLFEAIRRKQAAPYRYISMVKLYLDIFAQKQSTIVSRREKLNAGVSKLNEAAVLVAKLKEKAAEQQEKLAEKQAKANSALDMISNTMRNANTHKEEMETLKQRTEKENQQLMVRKREIEVELSEVEPLIQEARSAVGNIKTEALSEIRSLRAPPDVIRDILEGVLRLMGIQDTSWNSMKTFLAKRGVSV